MIDDYKDKFSNDTLKDKTIVIKDNRIGNQEQ
jgi:hypothetical protein